MNERSRSTLASHATDHRPASPRPPVLSAVQRAVLLTIRSQPLVWIKGAWRFKGRRSVTRDATVRALERHGLVVVAAGRAEATAQGRASLASTPRATASSPVP